MGRFIYDESSPSCLKYGVAIFSGEFGNTPIQVVGDVAGSLKEGLYWRVRIDKVSYQVHRLIYEHFFGNIPDGMVIDHIDRDRSNNRLSNLRLLSLSMNGRNKSKYKNNKSGVTGVMFSPSEGKEGYRVMWRESGKKKTKFFSINKYGDECAFRLACEYREMKMEELRAKGEWYDPTHGT